MQTPLVPVCCAPSASPSRCVGWSWWCRRRGRPWRHCRTTWCAPGHVRVFCVCACAPAHVCMCMPAHDHKATAPLPHVHRCRSWRSATRPGCTRPPLPTPLPPCPCPSPASLPPPTQPAAELRASHSSLRSCSRRAAAPLACPRRPAARLGCSREARPLLQGAVAARTWLWAVQPTAAPTAPGPMRVAVCTGPAALLRAPCQAQQARALLRHRQGEQQRQRQQRAAWRRGRTAR